MVASSTDRRRARVDRIGRIGRIDVGRVSRENRTLLVGNAAERRRDRHPSTQAEEHKSVFLPLPSEARGGGDWSLLRYISYRVV